MHQGAATQEGLGRVDELSQVKKRTYAYTFFEDVLKKWSNFQCRGQQLSLRFSSEMCFRVLSIQVQESSRVSARKQGENETAGRKAECCDFQAASSRGGLSTNCLTWV